MPVAVLPAPIAVAVTAPSAVNRTVLRLFCPTLTPTTLDTVSLIDVAVTAPCRLKSTGTSPKADKAAPVTFATEPDLVMPVIAIDPLAFSVADPLLDVLPSAADRPATLPPADLEGEVLVSKVPEISPLKVAVLVPLAAEKATDARAP